MIDIRWDIVLAGSLGYFIGRILYWFFLEDHLKAWKRKRQERKTCSCCKQGHVKPTLMNYNRWRNTLCLYCCHHIMDPRP